MPDGALSVIAQPELPGVVSDTGWELPENLTEQQWADLGRKLGHIERSVQWWVGEWWMYGERQFHGGKVIVTAADWDGPAYQTCKNAANCCRKFPKDRRRSLLTFTHHLEAASLPTAEADEVLDHAQQRAEQTGTPPPTRTVKTEVKKRKRAAQEQALADATVKASEDLGSSVYGVIYADPPWRFTPYSSETGMDRAADNHYPTMVLEDIFRLDVPAAEDAVLFLWATVPMLPDAVRVMEAWGFTYKSHCVWVKDHAGTGYWFRNKHELLLVGTRGKIPAPAAGEQFCSVIEAAIGRHSEKPEAFAEIIETMFPNVPAIEMFARAPRLGWAVWGNQTSQAVGA